MQDNKQFARSAVGRLTQQGSMILAASIVVTPLQVEEREQQAQAQTLQVMLESITTGMVSRAMAAICAVDFASALLHGALRKSTIETT